MKMNEAYPSKYMKADCEVPEEGDLCVVIASVDMEDVGAVGQSENKPVVYFNDHEKGFVLNKTNAKVIAKLYGDETDDWTGKPIALYSTDVDFKGDMVRAIRVKTKAPKLKMAANGRATATVAATAEDALAEGIDVPF